MRVIDRAKDVTVVILGGGRGQRLEPLTKMRAKPAVPLAGKYRLIDIPISNAINSGMKRMFVLTQFNSTSLHRHIASTYKFDQFSGGSVHLLAAQQTPGNQKWFQGTADAVRRNLEEILATPGDLVLILSGDHMYKMDYRAMLADHLEAGARVTLSVLPCSEEEIEGFGAVRVDPTGRVVEFREKPKDKAARAGMEADPRLLERWSAGADRPFLGSMGLYLFDKAALREALDNNLQDFGGDVIPLAAKTGKVQAHFFDGYWRDIGTIKSFFDTHMDLVRDPPPFDFNDSKWPFYTHPRYLPGATIDGSRFSRCILADGTFVKGSTLEEAVIGVRASVRNAVLKRVLVMGVDANAPEAAPGAPPFGIGEGSRIENAIIDKNARIGKNVRILNEHALKEAEGPGWAIHEGIVVVEKNAIIPDGTVI
jgi:glucose-1-phosphate adenylyltransferase